MVDSRLAAMERHGYRACMVSADHLTDLKNEIATLKRNGLIDERLQKWLDGYYDFAIPSDKAAPRSVIVVASRSLQVRFRFIWRGEEHATILPPTYIDFVTEAKVIEERLRGLFQDYNFSEAKNLPNKLLAVGSGLGLYGKNNLVYVDGFGSFLLLTAFYTDMICASESWFPLKRMKACDRCNKCMVSCPTSAIADERKTIKSSRCLTTYNESADSQTFPDWIDPSAHNSLVGCMKCQVVCPVNKRYIDVAEHTFFSEEETSMIMSRKSFDGLPPTLLSKLQATNLRIHYAYLARNLGVLLNWPRHVHVGHR